MAKIIHKCSWCKRHLFAEERDDYTENTTTHGMCEECELKLLIKSLPIMYEKLKKSKGSPREKLILGTIKKTENKINELMNYEKM